MSKRHELEDALCDMFMLRLDDAYKLASLIIDAAKEELRNERAKSVLADAEDDERAGEL